MTLKTLMCEYPVNGGMTSVFQTPDFVYRIISKNSFYSESTTFYVLTGSGEITYFIKTQSWGVRCKEAKDFL